MVTAESIWINIYIFIISIQGFLNLVCKCTIKRKKHLFHSNLMRHEVSDILISTLSKYLFLYEPDGYYNDFVN